MMAGESQPALLKNPLIAAEKDWAAKLRSELAAKGLVCSINPESEKGFEIGDGRAPDLVLISIDGLSNGLKATHLVKHIKRDTSIPVIALLSREALLRLDFEVAVDDFVVEPWDADEIAARAKRILNKTRNSADHEFIKCGALTIDLSRYEVYVSGKQVELTFKEYELLRFLARNKGRVFTREALLNEVWGYEYYGGDRTVDVHITRLRSKLEDPEHTFIDTVRNIGYKFKETA